MPVSWTVVFRLFVLLLMAALELPHGFTNVFFIDVDVSLQGLQVGMAEHLLQGEYVFRLSVESRRERMAQAVRVE